MEISHETIPCPDSIRATCLLVKIDTAKTWQPWPKSKDIYGFTYQHGFTYELAVEEVQKRSKKFPPWWRSVEVLTKTAYVEKKPTIFGSKWVLVSYGPSTDPVAPPTGTVPTLNFSDFASVSGEAGCNRFFAECSIPDGDHIQISRPGSTRMMCNEPEGVMEFEGQYLQLLSEAQAFLMDRDRLTLRCQRDRVLIFEKVFE
ncbi:MAG: META domain-containing protein [Bacteroidia bacterium]|nr:META domain-containing protein [Bacteroidia bacterium]